jgi:hypothetical protein
MKPDVVDEAPLVAHRQDVAAVERRDAAVDVLFGARVGRCVGTGVGWAYDGTPWAAAPIGITNAKTASAARDCLNTNDTFVSSTAQTVPVPNGLFLRPLAADPRNRRLLEFLQHFLEGQCIYHIAPRRPTSSSLTYPEFQD